MSDSEPAYSLMPDQLEAYTNVFKNFDKGNTGFCTWAEDFTFMFRAINQNPMKKEVDEIITAYPLDKEKYPDGDADKFDLHTWLTICDGKHVKDVVRDDNLLEAFRIFDKDGTGRIKIPALRYMMQAIGDKLSPEQADEFMDFANKEKTGDDEIDYNRLVTQLMDKDVGMQACL